MIATIAEIYCLLMVRAFSSFVEARLSSAIRMRHITCSMPTRVFALPLPRWLTVSPPHVSLTLSVKLPDPGYRLVFLKMG